MSGGDGKCGAPAKKVGRAPWRLVALALVVLLGISAFAIDVGFAYYAKRQLQSATDAAALAGAQDLPNTATALATAAPYSADDRLDRL